MDVIPNLCSINYYNSMLKSIGYSSNDPIVSKNQNRILCFFDYKIIIFFTDNVFGTDVPGIGCIDILIINYWLTILKNILNTNIIEFNTKFIIRRNIKEIDLFFYISNQPPTKNDLKYYYKSKVIDYIVENPVYTKYNNKYFCFLTSSKQVDKQFVEDILSNKYFNKILNISINIFDMSNKYCINKKLNISNSIYKFGIYEKKIKLISDLNSILYTKYSIINQEYEKSKILKDSKNILNILTEKNDHKIKIKSDLNINKSIYNYYLESGDLVLLFNVNNIQINKSLEKNNIFFIVFNIDLNKVILNELVKINRIKRRNIIVIFENIDINDFLNITFLNELHLINYSKNDAKFHSKVLTVNSCQSLILTCKKILK